MENWKDIKGYEGLYQVSDEGRVFSVRRNRTMKPTVNKIGYLIVNLTSKDGRQKVYNLHTLVANAFLEKTGSEINHKDEDKTNNRVDNLEWCDRQYNVTYGTGRKRAAESIGKPVVLENILLFHSAREASRFTGVDASNILHCCNGQQKTAGKNPIDGTPLHWKFYSEYIKCKE